MVRSSTSHFDPSHAGALASLAVSVDAFTSEIVVEEAAECTGDEAAKRAAPKQRCSWPSEVEKKEVYATTQSPAEDRDEALTEEATRSEGHTKGQDDEDDVVDRNDER